VNKSQDKRKGHTEKSKSKGVRINPRSRVSQMHWVLSWPGQGTVGLSTYTLAARLLH